MTCGRFKGLPFVLPDKLETSFFYSDNREVGDSNSTYPEQNIPKAVTIAAAAIYSSDSAC